MQDDQRSASACLMLENNLPRYMNPTIGKIRKYEDQIEEEVVQADELMRRVSPTKNSSLNRSKMDRSQIGSDRKIWKPTGMRDTSLEQSYHIRVERPSPLKSYEIGNTSAVLGNSKLLRARSTAALTPYDELAPTSTSQQQNPLSKKT